MEWISQTNRDAVVPIVVDSFGSAAAGPFSLTVTPPE